MHVVRLETVYGAVLFEVNEDNPPHAIAIPITTSTGLGQLVLHRTSERDESGHVIYR
jgi:hypothetical protein